MKSKLAPWCWLAGLAFVVPVAQGQSGQKIPEPAVWKMQQADDCLKRQDCDCAIPALEEALGLYPSYPEALSALGYCYLQKGQVELAAEKSNAALAISRRESLAFLTLGMIFERQGQTAKALENYEAASRLKQDDVNINLSLARLYEKGQRLDEAIARAKAALSSSPKNLAALFLLSQLYQEAERFDEAQELLRQVLKGDPENLSAKVRLSALYAATKQFDKAVENLQALLKVDYNQPLVHLRLGEVYRAAHKIDEATTHLSVAVELDPNFLEAKMALVVLLVEQNQTKEALELLDQVIAAGQSDFLEAATEKKIELLLARNKLAKAQETGDVALNLFPENPLFLRLAAQHRLALGQNGLALELARRFVEKFPDNSSSWSLQATVELGLGKFDEATASLQQALKLDPRNPYLFSNLGYLYAKKGDAAKAADWIRQALELQPGLVAALNNQALLKMREQPAEAERLLRSALEAAPESIEVQNNLGIVLALQGRFEDAVSMLDRAIQASSSEQMEPSRNLISILGMAGAYAQALEEVRKLLPMVQEDAQLLEQAAYLETLKGNLEEGASSYRMALEHASKEPAQQARLLYNLGTLLLNQERFDEAQSQLRKAVALAPELAEARNNLGCALLRGGRNEEARRAFREASKLKPQEKSFLLNRLAAGDSVDERQLEGIMPAEALEQSAASRSDAVVDKVYSALAAKRWSQAQAALLEASRSGASGPELQNALAVVLIRLQKPAEAKAELDKLLQATPDFPDALLNRAMLEELSLSDLEAALADYRRYLELAPDPKIRRHVESLERFHSPPEN